MSRRLKSSLSSYRIVYKDNKPQFASILSNLKDNMSFSCENRRITIESLKETPNTKSAEYVSNNFENFKWYRMTIHRGFCYQTSTGHRYRTYIAELFINGSKYIVMRNGNNIADYNFLIFDDKNKEFHFRRNFHDAYTVVNILTMSLENLPLLIGTDLCEKNNRMVLNRFREMQ